MKNHRPEVTLSEAEIERRADAALKRMLRTPPKPHDEMKTGKGNASRGKSTKVRPIASEQK